ncbi:hypothetical protein AXF42_Ash013465 [Apostasia shenzhenica]|uniref:Uncharacterized protein n=1 Tax=Apostasia shenzhenica TaxID=1088818 RepID=A0A2I0A499_9ASPA|nr:hypothetical protein AXF42_Ash013465 [Apostasia shenzhenica]
MYVTILDTDGFVIPSLNAGDSGLGSWDEPDLKEHKPPLKPSKQSVKEEEKIYLGPHGAPPQSKQQDLNAAGGKQRFRQKLKEADRRYSGTGRENKVESIRELVGGKISRGTMPKSSREWLDPHCHESQFERTSH